MQKATRRKIILLYAKGLQNLRGDSDLDGKKKIDFFNNIFRKNL